jgi:hypothetical protein
VLFGFGEKMKNQWSEDEKFGFWVSFVFLIFLPVAAVGALLFWWFFFGAA